MPFFLARDFDDKPAMSWHKMWKDVWLRFARGLNTISRFSLLKATVDRESVDPNVIIHANGKRVEGFFLTLDKHLDGSNNAEPNVWNIQIANIKISEPYTGGPAPHVHNSLSSLIVSYVVEFSAVDPDVEVIWGAYPSIDGVRFADGDAINNSKFGSTGSVMTLSGMFMATVLPGEHLLNLDLHLAENTTINQIEVQSARFNW